MNIELCSNNFNDNIFHYFLKGLPKISFLSDICDICINYNGGITQSDINKAQQIIHENGFKSYYVKKEYDTNKLFSIMQMRYDAHNINNVYQYSLLADDDMLFKENYDYDLLQLLYFMIQTNKNIGSLKINPYSKTKQIFIEFNTDIPYNTDGGILINNNTPWAGLVPSKYQNLLGSQEDILISQIYLKEFHQKGLFTIIDSCNHCIYDGVPKTFGKYNWHPKEATKDTVSYYINENFPFLLDINKEKRNSTTPYFNLTKAELKEAIIRELA